MTRRPPRSTRIATLFPYTTLFRSQLVGHRFQQLEILAILHAAPAGDDDAGRGQLGPLGVLQLDADESRQAGVAGAGDRLDRRRTSLGGGRSEEHTSELQPLMRTSYAVFCLTKKNKLNRHNHKQNIPHYTP